MQVWHRHFWTPGAETVDENFVTALEFIASYIFPKFALCLSKCARNSDEINARAALRLMKRDKFSREGGGGWKVCTCVCAVDVQTCKESFLGSS